MRESKRSRGQTMGRKIIRKIVGEKKVENEYETINTGVIYEIYKDPTIHNLIRTRRMQWPTY